MKTKKSIDFWIEYPLFMWVLTFFILGTAAAFLFLLLVIIALWLGVI